MFPLTTTLSSTNGVAAGATVTVYFVVPWSPSNSVQEEGLADLLICHWYVRRFVMLTVLLTFRVRQLIVSVAVAVRSAVGAVRSTRATFDTVRLEPQGYDLT